MLGVNTMLKGHYLGCRAQLLKNLKNASTAGNGAVQKKCPSIGATIAQEQAEARSEPVATVGRPALRLCKFIPKFL